MVLFKKAEPQLKVTAASVTDTFVKQLNGVIAARQVNVQNTEKRIETLNKQVFAAQTQMDESLAEITEAQGKISAVVGDQLTSEEG